MSVDDGVGAARHKKNKTVLMVIIVGCEKLDDDPTDKSTDQETSELTEEQWRNKNEQLPAAQIL